MLIMNSHMLFICVTLQVCITDVIHMRIHMEIHTENHTENPDSCRQQVEKRYLTTVTSSLSTIKPGKI